ncbi:MAG TPA: hypothetical protein VMW06_03340 [Desulfobacterales bacterium]|nr:hypothetical protein [Desulfobacterales bacterium]
MKIKNEDSADKGGGSEDAGGAEEFTQEDAEAAFAEGLGETAPETPDGTTDAAAPEGSEITDDASQPGAAGTETPGEETKDGDESSKKPTYEDLEKQLKDTQTWAHGLSETVVELKKKVDAPDPKGTKPGETGQDDDDMPEDIKSYLDDYPEARKAFEYLAKKQLGGMGADEIKTTVTSIQGQLNQANFEKSVVTGFMGEGNQWVDGHPDAYKIMSTPEYGAWFKAESQKDPTLGNISDPSDAIAVLTRYKTALAKSGAAAHDANLGGGMAQDVTDMAAAAVETGANAGPTDKPKTDEDKSPEEIFDEHAK